MSIINEALKKAGQTVVPTSIKKESSPIDIKSGFRPELIRKRKQMNWGPLFVLAVLALITAPIVAPLFHNPYKNTGATYSAVDIAELPAMKVSNSNMKAQFGMEETAINTPLRSLPSSPSAISRSVPNFSLNGIVYSSAESYCLINGKVIKTGEKIGGATLVKVTPNEAILDYEGEKVVLTANV